MSVRERKGEAEKLRCRFFVEGVAGTASRRGSGIGAKTWTTLARKAPRGREERPCAMMGARGPASGGGGGAAWQKGGRQASGWAPQAPREALGFFRTPMEGGDRRCSPA